MHNNLPLSVGIDVSKDTLDIAYKYQDNFHCQKIKNTKSEIQKIGRELKKMNYEGLIILESTSHYHFLVTLIFQQYELDIRVINPIISQKYLRSNVRKVKTDKADSQILANMALLEQDLPAKVEFNLLSAQIRLKIGLIKALEKQIQSMLGTLADFDEARENLGIESSLIENVIKRNIKELNRKKECLEQEVEKLIEAQSDDGDRDILKSIPGISSYMATLILFLLNKLYSAQSWVAYAGLDVQLSKAASGKPKVGLPSAAVLTCVNGYFIALGEQS